MKTVHITIDLETASLKPNAAIIQIAAVAWDAEATDMQKRPTIYDKDHNPYVFNSYSNLTTCLVKGMDFNAETIKWWASQSQEAKDALTSSTELESINDLILHFFEWIEETKASLGAEKVIIWAQGTDMDIAVLRTAAETVGIKTLPWDYDNVRDSRTFIKYICEMAKIPEDSDIFNMPQNNNMVSYLMPAKHNALYDALQSSWNVFVLHNVMKDVFSGKKINK